MHTKGTRIGASVALSIGILLVGLGSGVRAYTRPGVTELVSVTSGGEQAREADELHPAVIDDCNSQISDCLNAISANGRFVAFASFASDLVVGDTNKVSDIFVRDLARGTTERVSVSSSGEEGVGFCATDFSADPNSRPILTAGSDNPSISATGRYVVFWSCADNLVVEDAKQTMDVFVHDRKTGQTRLVSATADGLPLVCARSGNGCNFVYPQAISANGRYVAFLTRAVNAPEGYGPYVKDLWTGELEKVAVSYDGTPASGSAPVISANGRYVAFRSPYQNLVRGDTNSPYLWDVFVYDRKTGKTELINVAPDGTQEPGMHCCLPGAFMVYTPRTPGLSANGRYVAFASKWGGFVPNDANDTWDIFVKDRKTGRMERVSVKSAGQEVPAYSEDNMSLNADGRFVAFWSKAGLVDDDLQSTCKDYFLCVGVGGDLDPYVYDRVTGAIDLVSRAFDGTNEKCTPEARESNTYLCGGFFPPFPSLDASGRLVAFNSFYDRLVQGGDTNELPDTFVRDRGSVLGVGGLVRDGRAARLSLRGSPRFTHTGTAWIADPISDATDAIHELIGIRVSYRPLLGDLSVVLELASMPRTPALAAATAGTVYGMSFRIDGRSYEVRAASTGLGARGETTALFGLFSCQATELMCTKVADLTGGFGTTGERITFSIPLEDLEIENGSVMSHVRGFAAVGTLIGGPLHVLDWAA